MQVQSLCARSRLPITPCIHLLVIGERERANPVVRIGAEFSSYIYLRPYVVQLRMLQDYTLLFIRKDFKISQCLSQCHHVRIRVCVLALYSRNMDQSREDTLRRRRENEREHCARETPQQREAHLYQRRLRDRERAYLDFYTLPSCHIDA